MNSLIAESLPQNQTLHDMLHITEVMAIFVRFFAYFGQILVAMATSLRPLQSEMSSSDWLTTKTPCYK